MLKNENELNEKEGLAIWNPTFGVAYQIAGALNRLGTRMTALVPDTDSEKKYRSLSLSSKLVDLSDPSKTVFENHIPLETFVFCLDPWLSAPPSQNDIGPALSLLNQGIQTLGALRLSFPNIKSLFVLPQALVDQKSFIDQLSTVDSTLWVPTCFGFRDGFLFDNLMESFLKNPALLETRVPEHFRLPYLFAGDVAALTTTITLNKNFWGKPFYIPALNQNLDELRNSFANAFKELNETNWLERISAKLDSPAFVNAIESHLNTALAIPPIPEKVHNVYDVFPTRHTQLDRAFGILKRSHTKFKETELIFPPAVMP